MAANSETEINLKTLQRVDPNIIEIIDNASQVAMYKYERKSEKWEGTDIEGTLFLYRRSLYPYHGFIIVNRMSTTNFIESITSDMQFQLQEPYLLYKNHSGDIIGSWFYEDRDLRRITNKIQTIVLTQVPTPRRQRCASESETHPTKDVQDIMTLLSQAHEEYVQNMSPLKNVNKNAKESFNSIPLHSENDGDKTVDSSEIKSEISGDFCSQEKLISPRRRFLSADSLHSHSVSSLSPTVKEIVNEKVKICSKSNTLTFHSQKTTPSKNNCSDFIAECSSTPFKSLCFSDSTKKCFPSPSYTCQDSSAPTRLSPLFSRDEILSPSFSDIGILDESFEAHIIKSCASPKSKLMKADSDSANQNSLGKWFTAFNADYEHHSSAIKQALFSHFEDNSDVMLKIHEAYVSSLKSVFRK